jgi:hypothetical protein
MEKATILFCDGVRFIEYNVDDAQLGIGTGFSFSPILILFFFVASQKLKSNKLKSV